MKVNELITELQKQPLDAEVVFWKWDGEAKVSYLTFGCFNNLSKNKKFFTLLEDEMRRTVFQEEWHELTKVE